MFTGIIENTGAIRCWRPERKGGKFFVEPRPIFRGVRKGDSVAVNGCCLTVVGNRGGVLEFDVSDETMRKTALGDYRKGDFVNLERPVRADGRFGGHVVLGHVDGVGVIREVRRDPGSVAYFIAYPKKFSPLMIEKGSVAVDGISLTVCELKPGRFTVYIIPHTIERTNLGAIKADSRVNLEFDVIGKYVAGLAKAYRRRMR